MNPEDLLIELSQHGVRLKLAADGQLAVTAPKGNFTDALRQRVARHKPLLIEWLKQRHEAQAADGALPIIQPDPARWHESFPLSELQASFYIGQGEDMEYHVRPHYYIEEEFDALDVPRYESALNAALHRQRHSLPVLTSGVELQVPRTFTPLRIRLHDLGHLSQTQAEAAMLSTRERMSRQILPLDRWPWMAVEASIYAGSRVRLHLNSNNFFGDGPGTQRLFATVRALYREPDLRLPELTLGFRDCVLALAKLEQSAPGQAAKRYWEERVPTLPGPPPLPRVSGLDTRTRSHLERRKTFLSSELWAQFKHCAQERDITPSNALIAVYAEVIRCWSGSRHFLLNNMATHRFPMHAEMREVFGNFASLYPLEVDWREFAPFDGRARRLQDRLATDMRHTYWSGVKVLQALNQAQKAPGRAPCPFVVGSGLFMQGWEDPHYSCLETPQALLDYQFWELADGSLLVAWDLIERFFPDGMVDAMQRAYEDLLTLLAEDGNAWSCTSFELLPAPQQNLRRDVNATEAPIRRLLLHDGLRASAECLSDKPAVIAPDRSLTYGELDRAAHRLAHNLRESGVGPGQRVAILLDKGWQQAVAVHAVLATGAAYVPMDPQWPAERVQSLLGNVAAAAVVSSIDSDGSDGSSFPRVHCSWTPDDLAYVIFTSGSTGMPKGVMIGHRGAVNTVHDINRRFGVTESDVIFGISSLCFDLSVYDLFGCFAAGATLVLPRASAEPEPIAWLEQMQRHSVTVWNSVPALMQLLVDAAETRGVLLPTLRLVLLSGDWIAVGLPAQIRRVAPNARVVSLGGATEASIWSISFPIDEVDTRWTSIPYGKPLTNQTWHVLDDAGHDAPTWVAGHLHIGGIGLAKGYWGDAAKTDAAFIHHALSGERLYRTGDLGRYLPDGNIEFLGRADFQVKIQGYRVELGEIEAVLIEHPHVQASAVIATGSQAGRQLIGFFVAEAGAAIAPDALQAHLRAKLPAYMVPQHLVKLEQLPLTPHGKVDRSALAPLGPAGSAVRGHVAPRNDVERGLAALWEELLDVQPVGVADDFFDLGGQSFAAVRMMTRISQQYGQDLSLGVLLELRTVEALALRLQNRCAWSPLVLLRAQGEGTPTFFVHPAGGNVLCYRPLADRLRGPFFGLQAPGLAGEQTPIESIEEMAELYLAAIRTTHPNGPYVLGGWSSGGMIAFEIARRLEMQGEEVERVVMVDAPAPLQRAAVDDLTLLRWFLEDLDVGIDAHALRFDAGSGGLDMLPALLRQLSDEQRIAPNLHPEQLSHVLAVFVAIVRAGRRYEAGTIAADITVVRAAEMRVNEFSDHPAISWADWGWSRFTQGDVRAVEVTGTHYTLLGEHHVDAVAAAMRVSELETVG